MTAPCRVKVEIAFDAGPATASPTWTDVSADVSLAAGITFNRGRGQTSTTPEPGRLQLTLNNDSGDYTWGKVGNASTLGRGDRPPLRQPIRLTLIPLTEAEWLLGEATLWLDAEWLAGLDSVTVWSGFVDEWSQEWDNGWRPRVRVTASDRLAKLALLNLDDGAIMSEIKDAGPVAYYPLDEPAGATSVGDRTPDSLAPLADTPLGSGGGTVDLGSGVSPDGIGTVAAFTPASSTSARHLTGPRQLVASDSWTLSAWFIVSSYPTIYGVLASASSVPEYCVARISVVDNGGFGHGVGVGWSASFSAEGGIYYTTAIDDGGWHHLAGVYDDAAGGWLLYLDGALVDSNTYAAGTFEFDTISIGGGRLNPTDTGQNPFDGNIAHVALFDRALSLADITRLYESGWSSGPFYGDTASERFERLCRLGALPAGSYATDAAATTVLDRQPLGGIGLLEAIQQVTDSERGVVYVDGAGVLTYLADATLAAQPVALVLDNDDIEGDLSVYVNDQTVVNDVTVTRPTGATQRRADTVSQATMGVTNAVTVDTLLTTDAAAGALADRLLSEGTAVQPVTGALTVDLMTRASTVDAATLLALDTGARVQVAGLPASAPVDTLDLRVEGIAGSVSDRACTVTLTVSPALTVAAWELEDGTYGVLDQTTRLAWP